MIRPTRSRGGATYVALLRGINVGGKNKLPMKELVTMFDGAGCTDTRTYIQSGNVIFRSGSALAERLPGLVAEAIEQRFGFRVPVMLRSANELRNIAANNPYGRSAADTKLLHVAFLADHPDPSRIAGLDPERSPPDEFRIVGREIYLYCPNGVARTKLTNAYFDSKLATTSTVRNWATLSKLIELVS